MYLLQKEKKNEENANGTDKRADALQQAIDDLPAALAHPSRNWQITSLSCHSDKTAAGYTFTSLYPKQEEEVLKAFHEFAKHLFPPETRKQGSAQMDDVNPPGDTEFGFDTDLQSEEGLQVPDDTAVSSSGVEDGLDTDHGPDDSEFTEPEDGVERDEEDRDEVAAENEEEERNGNLEMAFDASTFAEADASFHSTHPNLGLDFGGFDDFDNSHSISLSRSAVPGLSVPAGFQPEVFGDGLAAPTSFGYTLASSSYPSDNVIPDFSFSSLLDSSWDFTGIDLNTFNVPISKECSTSPRKRGMWAIHEPAADPFTLPFLPIPPPSIPEGSPEPSQRLHTQAIHDPAILPILRSQCTPKKTAVLHSPTTCPTLSATIGLAQVPESFCRCPQKSAAKTGSQKRKNTGKATLTPVTQSIIPEEGAPLTQAPPTEPRMSKHVPVKSKRNEVANAIGTNNLTFVVANKAAGGVGEHTSHKRMGANSTRGEEK
ncbi:hypothetical protein JVT61DRAFT_6931 [Boletus reticuloceps]|uniref:Uncharacterized protein n=1 Tax=Boletus reticuloceps TaxID=495285 RepID=A0A8I2YJA9_9AGAM|nr:hypothetical protein JVT61DRAFT_6931 [Boletus reticuloceps]